MKDTPPDTHTIISKFWSPMLACCLQLLTSYTLQLFWGWLPPFYQWDIPPWRRESILSEGPMSVLRSSSTDFSSITGHCWPHPPPRCQTFPGSDHSLLAFAHGFSFPCLFLATRSHCVTQAGLELKISPASASQTLGISVQGYGCPPSPPDTLTWSLNFQVQSSSWPRLDHLEFCWIWF